MPLFNDAEIEFLAHSGLGRLTSIGLDGVPQVHSVTFVVDEILGCIEIGGRNLRDTNKYRNIRRDPRVTLVVDDHAQPLRGPHDILGKGIEVHGLAEATETPWPMAEGFGTDVIRIRPIRIESSNVDELGHHTRWVDAP